MHLVHFTANNANEVLSKIAEVYFDPKDGNLFLIPRAEECNLYECLKKGGFPNGTYIVKRHEADDSTMVTIVKNDDTLTCDLAGHGRSAWRTLKYDFGEENINGAEEYISSFLECIEQAALESLPTQTSSTIRGDSYAGIYIWQGSDNITQHISKSLMENARDPQSMLEYVAAKSIKQLERHNIMQSPEVQALQKDAERYRWLKEQFRIMSPDMGGNHTWVLKRPIRRGQTMDAACDAAMGREND